MLWEWNGFHRAFAMEFNHRFRHFCERFCIASTAVEDTRNTILPAPNVNLCHIAYINEITAEVLTASK